MITEVSCQTYQPTDIGYTPDGLNNISIRPARLVTPSSMRAPSALIIRPNQQSFEPRVYVATIMAPYIPSDEDLSIGKPGMSIDMWRTVGSPDIHHYHMTMSPSLLPQTEIEVQRLIDMLNKYHNGEVADKLLNMFPKAHIDSEGASLRMRDETLLTFKRLNVDPNPRIFDLKQLVNPQFNHRTEVGCFEVTVGYVNKRNNLVPELFNIEDLTDHSERRLVVGANFTVSNLGELQKQTMALLEAGKYAQAGFRALINPFFEIRPATT